MSEGALFDPRDFVIADGIAHLWPVAQSACLHRHVTTFSRYLRDKINSMAGRFAPIPDGSPMRATRPQRTLALYGFDGRYRSVTSHCQEVRSNGRSLHQVMVVPAPLCGHS
jgi:hypothetical protein